jgi:hypothetical protein
VFVALPLAAVAGQTESRRLTTSRDAEIRALLETALKRLGESAHESPNVS